MACQTDVNNADDFKGSRCIGLALLRPNKRGWRCWRCWRCWRELEAHRSERRQERRTDDAEATVMACLPKALEQAKDSRTPCHEKGLIGCSQAPHQERRMSSSSQWLNPLSLNRPLDDCVLVRLWGKATGTEGQLNGMHASRESKRPRDEWT